MMKHNVGTIDRVVRIVVGVALSVTAWLTPMAIAFQVTAFIVAAILIITALVGFCPAYAVFGVSTCKQSQQVSGS